MNNNLTEIIFIIDKSGSMWPLADDTVGGFNSFIEEQKKLEGEVKLTTVLFSTSCDTLHDGINLKEVKPLTKEDYTPSGCTALYDAIGCTITKVGQRLAATDEDKRPGKVIVCITTDGEENASLEYSQSKIKEMIEEQQSKYSWEFIFLGANMDAVNEGSKVGISKAFNYSATSKGTASLYASVSKGVESYRSAGVLDSACFDSLE